MELSLEQDELIADMLPIYRGNVAEDDLTVLNATLYVAEHGCKWRGLPARFGKWHTISMQMNRWSKAGFLDAVFGAMQERQLLRVTLEFISLDSTVVKVHPDSTGAIKRTIPNPSESQEEAGRPKFIWLPRMSEQP